MLEVLLSILFNGASWHGCVSANSNVDNYIRFIINDFHALLNCRSQVDVPDCAAIHEDMAVHMLGWKEAGD